MSSCVSENEEELDKNRSRADAVICHYTNEMKIIVLLAIFTKKLD